MRYLVNWWSAIWLEPDDLLTVYVVHGAVTLYLVPFWYNIWYKAVFSLSLPKVIRESKTTPKSYSWASMLKYNGYRAQ